MLTSCQLAFFDIKKWQARNIVNICRINADCFNIIKSLYIVMNFYHKRDATLSDCSALMFLCCLHVTST